jgi:hypothetical protein
MLWQQRWLNFVGALIGWLVLRPVGVRYLGCLSSSGCPAVAGDWWTVFAGLVAFLGITGYIPYAVIGLIHAVLGALRTVAKIIADWLKP